MNKLGWMGGVVLFLLGSHAQAQTDPSSEPPVIPIADAGDEVSIDSLIADRRDSQGRRCELRALVRSGGLRYLACGEAGVWVIRIAPERAPEIIEQRATPGSATGFFLRDGTLWVETTTIQAQRLAPVEPTATVQTGRLTTTAETRLPAATDLRAPVVSPPSAASPGPNAPAPPPSPYAIEPELARVVALEPGFAVIDMGRSHGVNTGDHVAFERIEIERVGAEETERKELVAIGLATAVGPTRTRVALGVGERVAPGMTARPTREPLSASSIAPPRLGGLAHVGFIARPFLIVDDLGVGAAFEARGGYRFESLLHLEALIQPLAVGTGRDGSVTPMAGILCASFDSKLFEVGLGIGGQTVNDPAFDLEAGSGTTLAQRVRIGAVDGTMIELFSYVVLFHSEFELADLQFHGQVRVGERSWLVANAGGGSLGFGFADVGLRVMIEGNGDHGTVALTATVGGVHMYESRFDAMFESNVGSVDYTGPMIGFGADWRL